MNILVTGGAGYVGSRLLPRLLEAGHQVVVYDAMFFGRDHLGDHPSLKVVCGDVRDTAYFAKACRCFDMGEAPDVVLHLACISNDPSFELDESLSRTMNYECFEPLVIAAKEAGTKRFVYCSSSSVYGISDAPDVTEEHPLVPITLYNTYKAKCEPILFRHQSDDFTCVTIRPSTVCGYSPRMRLDLSVNILTNLAVNKGVITVFGGAQMRPNLHIEDMVDAYLLMIEAPKDKIAGQTFNIGKQNLSIAALAEIVCAIVEEEFERTVAIETQPLHDQRSYQVNSDKIARVLGFKPKRTVQNAVHDLCAAFRSGLIPDADDDRYYNVRQMRKVMPDLYRGAPPSKFDPAAGHMSEIDLKRMEGMTLRIGFCGMTHLGQTLKKASEIRGFETRRWADGGDIVFVTPDVEDHGDLSEVEKCMTWVVGLPDHIPIVLASQVPPGFTRPWLKQRRNIFYQVDTIIMNRALERATLPERIIVGCEAGPAQGDHTDIRSASNVLPATYVAYLAAFNCPIITMSFESAELSKLAINYYLAKQIEATNALAAVACHIGADWDEMIPGLRLDARIGQHAYIRPGEVGGHLPRDVRTIARLIKEAQK